MAKCEPAGPRATPLPSSAAQSRGTAAARPPPGGTPYQPDCADHAGCRQVSAVVSSLTGTTRQFGIARRSQIPFGVGARNFLCWSPSGPLRSWQGRSGSWSGCRDSTC